MFVIKYTHCGREQQWATGVDVGTADIQLAGFTVYCVSGHVVTEEEGTMLREIQINLRRACKDSKQAD